MLQPTNGLPEARARSLFNHMRRQAPSIPLIPRAGPARERLRIAGQFWTPAWIADAMVSYVIQGGSDHIFDPAVGAGAFFRAAKAASAGLGRELALLGTEIDRDALAQGLAQGLTALDLNSTQIRDFALNPPDRMFDAIVGNPPYIRHHRISQRAKAELRAFCLDFTGIVLDGRAGLHVYFLLRALQRLATGGRLAFILPADTCEGKFAPSLWSWISAHYRLDAIVTFAPDATPFPGVDTNAIIALIRNEAPRETFHWAVCVQPETSQLRDWITASFTAPGAALEVHERLLDEGLATGLSRPPLHEVWAGPQLGDFASVTRGIATGANDFFFLTRGEAKRLGIPETLLRSAIGRTRDVSGSEITLDNLRALDSRGRPTALLTLGTESPDTYPPQVRAYLEEGIRRGLPERPLIATRRPWYKMESRAVPPFLFAYLGRRNARFIRNSADVLPLTGFLCVYPRSSDPVFIEKLWRILSHPMTVANLGLVGKTYGSGAIKVEPRALERLPIPTCALEEAGITRPEHQPSLWS